MFATSAPAGTPRCPINGCGQSRIAPDCQRHFCRKHCIAGGGCSSKTHTGHLSSLVPARLVTAAQPSGVHLSSPPPSLPPSTSATGGDVPLPKTLSPSANNTPFQASPSAHSLDARPNSRFNSHMPAIFTDQWKREQEMEVERKRMESVKKVHATQVKHTVTVYAWSEDSKPAIIQDFQEGLFTWPYFPISSYVLSALSLAGPEMRIQLYRETIGNWVTISTGHVIEVKEGARVFLKASHVINYADFDKLLNPKLTSAPHLRYNLAGERRELRERYKAVGKGKAPRSLEVTSSEDEDASDGIDKQPPFSQRYFRKQTLPASLFHPLPSPPTTAIAPSTSHPDIIDISSDDSSSTIQYLPQKRKPSNQGSLSAPKRRNASHSHKNDCVSIIELSDDSDHPSSASTAVAIKVELDTEAYRDKQWPADFYTIDIVNFIGACEANPDVQLKTLFQRHFPNVPYRRSTFNENRSRWLKAPQSVCDIFLKAKRTDGGKWSAFQKQTRKKSQV